MPEPGRYVGSVALSAVAALCLLIAGVGLVALVAEFQQSWTAYHVMEQTVERSAPVAVGLAVVAIATSFAAVFRAG